MAKPRKSHRGMAESGSRFQSKDARIEPVMKAAEDGGLLKGKTGRISGRVSPRLVRQAKQNTGISSDSELIAFALASLAIEDRFLEAFDAVQGKVDPDLKLGF